MDITVILTLYKRPYTLIEQLIAIQNQSIQPESIILWKNYAENIFLPEIPENLKKNLTIIDSTNNFGVWARFSLGLLAKTKYVCIFDDDTIPGKDWFKNCLDTMKVKRGLLGTIGIIFKEGNNYEGKVRYGWDGPSENIEQVDIVGHSWFFEREWLSELWKFNPDYDTMLCAGEDIAFSYQLQQIGINTYVPPHPVNNINLWGSIPNTAWKYGNDNASIYLNEGSDKFDKVLKLCISKGFKTIMNSKIMNSNLDINSNSINHLNFFISKIEKKESFAIIRPGDGEYLIMTNKYFNTQDNWEFKGGNLQKDLLSVKDIIKDLNNFFVGIPCPDCQGKERVEWYKNIWNLEDAQITYANIFCNRNWNKFINFLIESQTQFNYIGPCKNNSFKLNVKNIFNIDELLVNNWDLQKDNFIKDIIEWIDNIIIKDFNIFMFSAGPISKYIIPILYKKYSNCQFIDVGSSLDIYMKGSTNRGYINETQHYTNIICDFNRGHKMYSENDIVKFEGGWSYTPNEIREFLKFINFRESYKILEFGAGSSTQIFYDIIDRYCYNIEYDTYENDIKYKIEYKNVNTIMYNLEDIDKIKIPNKKYDIIIIDGPHGELRKKWYSKIRYNIKYDTIMLIDDYNHYLEFENELNKNYTYTILSKSDAKFVPYGEHSWRIITDLILKI